MSWLDADTRNPNGACDIVCDWPDCGTRLFRTEYNHDGYFETPDAALMVLDRCEWLSTMCALGDDLSFCPNHLRCEHGSRVRFDPEDEATWPVGTELRSRLEDAWLAFTPLPECERTILALIEEWNQRATT